MGVGVPVLSADQLAPVVSRILDAPDAWPSEWSCARLDVEAINPSTAGLYRVVGTATAGGGPARPWRAVLKVVTLPDFAGTPLEHGYITEPQDWNYWKREVLARRSGLLDRFSSPLRPVRCWGTDDIDDTTAWLWLEELDSTPAQAVWSLTDLAEAVYDWGAFAAQGVAASAEVRRVPWAARGWLRGWVSTMRGSGAEHASAHDGCWNHPLVRDRLSPSARTAYARLITDAERVFQRLDALPQTVAHHDTQRNNLFHETGGRSGTVAIDWSFFGTAPIGEDLGHHIALNVYLGSVRPLDGEQHAETATEAYLAGLRAYGWRGNEDDVQFAAYASGALQMLSYAATYLADLCPEFGDQGEPWPEQAALKQSRDVAAVMDDWCQAFEFLATLAERVRPS